MSDIKGIDPPGGENHQGGSMRWGNWDEGAVPINQAGYFGIIGVIFTVGLAGRTIRYDPSRPSSVCPATRI